MGFWLSDLVVSATLFINAAAILNFSIRQREQQSEEEFVEEGSAESMKGVGAPKATIGDNIRQVLQDLRTLRIFIALWNIIVIIL